MATQYRAGSAFLVGDAAHQFYPTGGFGANAGIADAVDLGWKLAATVNGWGGPHLLASYEMERRPAALFYRELCAGLLEVSRRFQRLTAAGASLLDQRGGGLLRQADPATAEARGVPLGGRTAGRHQPLPRRDQRPPKPFTWTADPDKIIAAVRRGHQALIRSTRVHTTILSQASATPWKNVHSSRDSTIEVEVELLFACGRR